MATKYHTLYQAAIIVLAIIALSRPQVSEQNSAVPETEQHGELHAGNSVRP